MLRPTEGYATRARRMTAAGEQLIGELFVPEIQDGSFVIRHRVLSVMALLS